MQLLIVLYVGIYTYIKSSINCLCHSKCNCAWACAFFCERKECKQLKYIDKKKTKPNEKKRNEKIYQNQPIMSNTMEYYRNTKQKSLLKHKSVFLKCIHIDHPLQVQWTLPLLLIFFHRFFFSFSFSWNFIFCWIYSFADKHKKTKKKKHDHELDSSPSFHRIRKRTIWLISFSFFLLSVCLFVAVEK